MIYNKMPLFVILVLHLDSRTTVRQTNTTGIWKVLIFPDFHPFIAPLHKYKKDLAEEEKKAFTNKKMDEIKKCTNMEGIITKMFDYKIKVAEIEKEILHYLLNIRHSTICQIFSSNCRTAEQRTAELSFISYFMCNH